MSKIYQAYQYLEQIKSREINFLNFINKGLSESDSFSRAFFRDTLKALVNRYYFLEYEVNNVFKELDENQKDYFIAVLGVYHYFKDFHDDDICKALSEDKELFTPEIDVEKRFSELLSLNHAFYPISEEDSKHFAKYVSLHFSYPLWIVKMLTKHHGHKTTYKALSSSRKNIPLTVKVNLDKTTSEEILSKYPNDFQKGKLVEGSLYYLGKNIIAHPLFKNNEIIVEDEVSQLLESKLDAEPLDNVLLIYPKRDVLVNEVSKKMEKIGKLQVMMNDLVEERMLKNYLLRFNNQFPEVFNCNIDLLLTYMPYDSVDKALMFVPSTNFGLIRRNPQELLSLKMEEIDNLLNTQRKMLEEGSLFIKDGGKLIYACYTYNKKETTSMIKTFLENHQEFTLEEERMIFAHEIPSDGVYYAVLRKGENDD